MKAQQHRGNHARAMALLPIFMILVTIVGACGVLEQGFGIADPTATQPLPSPLPTVTFSAEYATLTPIPSPTSLATATPYAMATVAPLPSPTASRVPTPTPTPHVLTLWIHDDDYTIAAVQELVDEFFRREGIALQIVPKTEGQLRIDLLATSLTDTPGPDIIWGDQDDLMDLVTDGQLTPVSWYNGESVEAARVGGSAHGQQWGIPLLLSDHLLLLGNRSMMTTLPETTDELIMQSRAVSTGEIAGIVSPWTEARWLLAWLNGFGGAPTSPDGQRPTLKTPEMISALNLLLELRQAAPEGEESYEEMQARMHGGQAALAVDGTWALESYQQALGDQLLMAPMPVVAATGRYAAPTVTTTYLMFRRATSEPYASQAMRFGEWLGDSSTQARLAQHVGRLPALRSAMTQPEVLHDPLLRILALQIEDARGIPPSKAMRCAIGAIQTQLPLLVRGERDQEATVDMMQAQADECVGE